MKKRSAVIFLAAVFLLVSISTAFSQKTEWEGKIEYENGIPIVKNPSEPLFGEITLEFEEDLSIGKNPDSGLDFYRGLRIVVDEDGNITLFDLADSSIHVFDRTGKHKLSFGGRGQGPGEINSPLAYMIESNNKGNLFVFDHFHGIKIFDSLGNYIDILRTLDFVVFYRPLAGDNVIALCKKTGDKFEQDDLILLERGADKEQLIFSFPKRKLLRSPEIGIDRAKLQVYAVAGKVLMDYGPEAKIAPLSKDRTIAGYNNIYRLMIIDSSGEIITIIEKEESPRLYSKKERKEIIRQSIYLRGLEDMNIDSREVIKLIDFPEHYPFFENLMTDDQDHVFVGRPEAVFEKRDHHIFDLFDCQGRYVFKVISPIRPRIIKNGFCYYIGRNKEGESIRVIRSRIKNWEEIIRRIEGSAAEDDIGN